MYIKKETLTEVRQLPRSCNGIANFQNAPIKWVNENDYFILNKPELAENEVLIPVEASDFNEETKEYNQRKRLKTEAELQEDADIKITQIKERLREVLASTLEYARAILMGKSINDDLDYFESVYKAKYEACKGNSFDDLLTLELSKESIDGVTTLEQYKAYVIGRFEQGQGVMEQVKAMVEVFRKTILKDISEANNELAEQRITELDNLPATLSPQEFGNEFIRIISLT